MVHGIDLSALVKTRGQVRNVADFIRLTPHPLEQSPFAENYATEDTVFGVYSRRLFPASCGPSEDILAQYWKLRSGVMLYDVPERPLEIGGPESVRLLEKVLCRNVGDLGEFRARYLLACDSGGGIIMDGVVIRLGEEKFWYVVADGEFEPWITAHAVGMDAYVHDPGSRVLQIQGPKSIEFLEHAAKPLAEGKFSYFKAGLFDFAGQAILVSRTGWTGEAGIEIYANKETDCSALWDHLLEKGRRFGIEFASSGSMNLRRVESGILNNTTDMDREMTPFAAGLGKFVDFANPNFIGRRALEIADRRCLLFGLACSTEIPKPGREVFQRDHPAGKVTVGCYSPTLEKGIGYVHFFRPRDDSSDWEGQTVEFVDDCGIRHKAEVVSLPFFDKNKRLPRCEA